MKYIDTSIVFREVPDEITLAINISGCPLHCEGCHSPWLWEDTGSELSAESLSALIDANPGITCVSLMGGDADPEKVVSLLQDVRLRYAEAVKTCWYSGRDLSQVKGYIVPDVLDYIKTGPYIASRGPLDREGTNQRMYRVMTLADGTMVFKDITSIFWL